MSQLCDCAGGQGKKGKENASKKSKQSDEATAKSIATWQEDEETMMLNELAVLREKGILSGMGTHRVGSGLLGSVQFVCYARPRHGSVFGISSQSSVLHVQEKHARVAKVLNKAFFNVNPAKYPHQRTGQSCCEKWRIAYMTAFSLGKHISW